MLDEKLADHSLNVPLIPVSLATAEEARLKTKHLEVQVLELHHKMRIERYTLWIALGTLILTAIGTFFSHAEKIADQQRQLDDSKTKAQNDQSVMLSVFRLMLEKRLVAEAPMPPEHRPIEPTRPTKPEPPPTTPEPAPPTQPPLNPPTKQPEAITPPTKSPNNSKPKTPPNDKANDPPDNLGDFLQGVQRFLDSSPPEIHVPESKTKRAISGHVRLFSGQPISGVEVTGWNGAAKVAACVSKEDGSYILFVDKGTRLSSIQYSKPGFVTYSLDNTGLGEILMNSGSNSTYSTTLNRE